MINHKHPANIALHDKRSSGDKAADTVTKNFGSWKYIMIQTVFVVIWLSFNIWAGPLRFDKFPFILLNLAFSAQATYAAPIILLSQNRSSEHDRLKAEHDYAVNSMSLKFMVAIHEQLHGVDCDCPPKRDVEALLQTINPELTGV